ncbi:uncharacterized protein F5147DRAFT_652828 [Suillus discolor]|uniref:Uncharacterized protein n=1 Tax=Suillus discolor TaxID=1912936 RepID=A0A9P7JTU0_9AGAM|nr:uncharacterized protein F5147DRAFT_652828 [Suillus discolor]KAG2108468.1 hypothetical protein F5147DRAFT_652828 [Suillus discolor]
MAIIQMTHNTLSLHQHLAGKRWLHNDHTFDDYEDGPTIEMLKAQRDINPTTIFQSEAIRLSSAWMDWVNHGYRITPSSFHMFYLCDPIATMDHIIPIGTTNSYDTSNQIPDRVTGAYSLARLGPSQDTQHTHVTDVKILSASELIESAQYDPPLYKECRFGHNSFVRGRTSHRYGDGPAMYVDLERDAIKFSEDEIETSLDIDSIIWTTKVFRCRGSVGIYVTPPFQTKPGIFKHNHAYVDITIPQSEEDANTPGGRTEWLSKRFPMSAIPHTCIGRISSASSTLNLYIAFPRMIYYYLDHMEACIRDGEGELSMYGLLFFILEGKGIKLLMKDEQRGQFSGPEEALLHNLPDLNWKYMMNRRHGELLVDISISFTPHSPEVPISVYGD